MIRNRSNVPKKEWAPNHFAWALVENDELSVKLEEIPIGGKSNIHYHKRARQFFFVLNGKATVKVENQEHLLKNHDEIEIPQNKRHQISNTGAKKLLFILVSSPRVLEDDIFE
ncbi:MAG: cupin domain-containing protein [Candidatus Methanofastidiosia archaeon]